MRPAACCTSMRSRRLARSRLIWRRSGADLLTLSAHKLGGPKGAGALVLAEGVLGLGAACCAAAGRSRGGGPGPRMSLPLPAFGAATKAAMAARDDGRRPSQGLRDRLEAGLRSRPRDAIVFSDDARRLPNTVLFSAPGLKAETAVIGFDLAGIAVSSGSACSSGKVQPSHVLHAMGFGPGTGSGSGAAQSGLVYVRNRH